MSIDKRMTKQQCFKIRNRLYSLVPIFYGRKFESTITTMRATVYTIVFFFGKSLHIVLNYFIYSYQ